MTMDLAVIREIHLGGFTCLLMHNQVDLGLKSQYDEIMFSRTFWSGHHGFINNSKSEQFSDTVFYYMTHQPILGLFGGLFSYFEGPIGSLTLSVVYRSPKTLQMAFHTG